MTGVDCDRLDEERRRGITIELGFAPLALPGGRTVSIVDVPGHERFIRQMVAGASGIDAVLLVVAADEGVMPQTREHLDILNLLGISAGLVVLTKTDKVDEELMEMAVEDVMELTRGTFLENSPVIPVSAVTGDGLPSLVSAVEELVDSVPVRDRSGAFFLPVDRAFSMKGFGSVVTGTSFYGSLSEGEEVDVMPSGLRTKVRSIQVHGEPAASVVAGQRTAINLASVPLDQIKRGDVICARGRYASSSCFDALLSVLPSAPEPVTHWQRVRLHIGTTDTVARISMLSAAHDGGIGEIQPGGKGLVQMLPDDPVTVAAGERFVIRFYSPLATIGGGCVLIPNSERPRHREERARRVGILEELALSGSRVGLLRALTKERGSVSVEELFSLSQMERDDFESSLRLFEDTQDGEALRFGAAGGHLITDEALAQVGEELRSILAAFHRERPELSGMEADDLLSAAATRPGVFGYHWLKFQDPKDFKSLLKLLASRGAVSETASGDSARFAMPDFTPGGGEAFMKLVGAIRDISLSSGFELADSAGLASKLDAAQSEITRAIGFLKESDDLRVTPDGLLFPAATREKFLELISSLSVDMTVAAVRDAAGVSRKYALSMLEFFDSQGFTRRVGDKRVLTLRRF
jgi:selenocysteine-specific elongation factor